MALLVPYWTTEISFDSQLCYCIEKFAKIDKRASKFHFKCHLIYHRASRLLYQLYLPASQRSRTINVLTIRYPRALSIVSSSISGILECSCHSNRRFITRASSRGTIN
ncbi:unnamed protein product [Albugo candida]|uniref:Uncharacterized protein n=1 Tax=Albugo candida TaxID=65357 RepID=A0A024GGX9_9STRA|nr:unnamed protein product [Albugo candida]|eukprot:CCI45600.1 unnamed protein product [Albugo candida]